MSNHKEITPTQAQRLIEWVKVQDKFNSMDNKELCWNSINFANSLDLDITGSADAMICTIQDRLYPEYDGEKIKWTETGWETPDGEINYE